MGVNLSRQGGKRGAEPQQSLRERLLNQAAHAAVAKKGSHFQAVFRRLLPHLGYQSAIWAVAHRLCRLVWKILHEGVRLSSKATKSVPEKRRNVPRCWREHFASSATRSLSHP